MNIIFLTELYIYNFQSSQNIHTLNFKVCERNGHINFVKKFFLK